MQNEVKKYFPKESSFNTFIILRCLSESQKPLGSWILKERMEKMGGSISLASVGRLLKELDRRELTTLVQSQGRILTAKGNRQLETMQNDLKRMIIEGEMKEAAHPESTQDIIDLLNVRMLIESEMIKLIVKHANDEDIGRLEEAVTIHRHLVNEKEDTELLPINFHGVLSDISCNRFLNSILKLLIHEEIRLEEKFPEIAAKLRKAHHLVEHEIILEAVKERDVNSAIRYTKEHIQKLIKSVIY